jgi:hypothetical protein
MFSGFGGSEEHVAGFLVIPSVHAGKPVDYLAEKERSISSDSRQFVGSRRASKMRASRNLLVHQSD